jgi:hypothetical protein
MSVPSSVKPRLCPPYPSTSANTPPSTVNDVGVEPTEPVCTLNVSQLSPCLDNCLLNELGIHFAKIAFNGRE